MPLLITDGLGYSSNGTGGRFQFLGINSGLDYFDLVFSSPIVSLSADAADYTKYGLHVADGTSSLASIQSVAIVAGNVRLTTTPCTNGGLYTITLPSVGFFDGGDVFVGPYSMNAVAVGLLPQALSARAIDARLIEVVFINEAVVQSEAMNPANYSITPTLAVTAVAFVNANTYRVTTDRQTRGVSYTVVVSNIHDVHGDLI